MNQHIDKLKTEEGFKELLNNCNKNEIDSIIIHMFYSNNKLNCNYFRSKWMSTHKYLFDYLNTLYDDSTSIYETLYRLKNNIEKRPTCKICGSSVNFSKQYGFSTHCSAKCSALDKETVNNRRKTFIEKYGVSSYTKTEDYKQKVKDISLKKYGAEHYTKTNSVKEKQKNTVLQKYGKSSFFETTLFKQKSKQTCLQKYGVEYATQSDVSKQKSIQTCLSNYGTKYYVMTSDCREKAKNAQMAQKGYTGSKKENKIYSELKQYYPDIIREYKSKEYPFFADFFIPSLNLYIEFNGMWVHCSHAYDETSEEDQKILRQWQNKAQTSSYYKRAIKIWTGSDVEKRNYAKEHNLNWLECWSEKELIEKIKILYYGKKSIIQ